MPFIMKTMRNRKHLQSAIEQAKKSLEEGGFPAGAVIVKDNKIISEGKSLGFNLNDPTSHAEITAIRVACKKLNSVDLSNAVLYTSLEPCLMCFSAASWAGISRIVYGCKRTNEMISKGYYEGSISMHDVNKKNNRPIELVFLPDFENDSLALIKQWQNKRLP